MKYPQRTLRAARPGAEIDPRKGGSTCPPTCAPAVLDAARRELAPASSACVAGACYASDTATAPRSSPVTVATRRGSTTRRGRSDEVHHPVNKRLTDRCPAGAQRGQYCPCKPN